MSEQAQRVAHCLAATLEPEEGRRTAAEQQLKVEEQQPGFGTALVQVATSQEVPTHLRQLSAVLLKQYIRRHWVEGDDKFQPPETPEAEKQYIRQQLPCGLSDADSRVRTAVGMAVAAIASWDWSQSWPGLMDNIISSIRQRQDSNLVAGCLQCLSVMGSDLDEEQKPALMQVLAPELQAIMVQAAPAAASSPAGGDPGQVSAAAAAAGVHTSCLSIMGDLVGGLAALAGAQQKQVRSMAVGLLAPWLEVLAGVLRVPLDLQHAHYWSCQLEAVKLLQLLLTYFAAPLGDQLAPLLSLSWQLLTSGRGAYQQLVVVEEEEEEGEGDKAVLESLITQLFDLLLVVVERPRYQGLLGLALQQLVEVAVGYMQMTAEQVASWSDNLDQYVADDELEGASTRTSAELLLEELLGGWGAPAAAALLAGVAAAWAQQRGQGGEAGWKLREAGLQALGGVAGALQEAMQEGGEQQHVALRCQLLALLQDTLQRELLPLAQQQQQVVVVAGDEAGGGTAYLQGRALWVVSQYGSLLEEGQKEVLLQAAARSLSQPTAPLVQVGACRALGALLPTLPPTTLAPLCGPLLGPGGALVKLMGSCQEGVVHLVLELAAVVLEAGGEAAEAAAAAAGMELAGVVLQIWERSVADPLLSEDALHLLSHLAARPACLPGLATHTIGPLTATLHKAAAAAAAAAAAGGGGTTSGSLGGQAQHTQHSTLPPMLVEASLDLLGALVRPGQGEVAGGVARGALGALLGLAGDSEDSSEVAAAVRLLVKLMRVLGNDLLLCGPPGTCPDALLQQLLGLGLRLLSPSLPDDRSRPAAPLVVQLLRSYPSAAPSFLPALLPACLAKMSSGGSSPVLISELLVVFVLLARSDAAQLVNMLASLTCTLPDGSTGNGLSALLPLMCRHAPDMMGELRTKQVAAALLELLAQRRHPALVTLTVPSDELEEVAGGGRRTRAQTRLQGGLKYKQVPVVVQLLSVLGQLVAADQEGRHKHWKAAGGSDEEDEEDGNWELEEEGGGWGGVGGLEGQENRDANGAVAAQHAASGLAVAGGLVVTGTGGVVTGAGSGKRPALQLPGEDMLDFMDESTVAGTPVGGYGEEGGDPADLQDPLGPVRLRQVVRHGLGGLVVAGEGQLLQQAVQQLQAREAEALKWLFPQA